MKYNKSPIKKVFIWQGGWRGGAEQVLLGIAHYLQGRGVSVTIGLFRDQVPNDSLFHYSSVPRVLPKKFVAFNNLIAPLFFRRDIRDVDLVISHSIGLYGAAFQKLVYREPADLDCMRASLRTVSMFLYTPIYWYTRIVLKKIAFIVSASRKADAFFDRHNSKKYIASTNFITSPTVPLQKTYTPEKEPFTVVWIGRDDRIKQLQWVTNAVRAIAHKGTSIQLEIFGVDGNSDSIITYHGWKDRDVVLSYMRDHAHVFVLSSRFEASPLSLLEALSAGIPSIVHLPACPRELEESVTIFSDAEGLIIALEQCMKEYLPIRARACQQAVDIARLYEMNVVLDREFLALAHHLAMKDVSYTRENKREVIPW
ncbi:MAG TPA: glycosyltransferase family 4 protein [Candidatus Paceibacterota bacterium]|nr:glycosyltransferase family 4 protein [Candidatus Paceibacterota bacterium]